MTAVRFINARGTARYGRYRLVPTEGTDHLSAEAAAAKSADYLLDEIATRTERQPVTFRVLAQLANDGDVVDNATIHWPEDRTLMELGNVTLTTLVPDSAEEQRTIIFDPIPRVDGIEPSADPLLELRAAIYLLSGRRRRAAGSTAASA